MWFTDRKTLFTDRIPLLSIRSIRTDRQTVYNHSCHENILSPTKGGNQKSFIREGSAPRYDRGAGLTPYPSYHFWQKKVPLSYTFYSQNNGSSFTYLVKNFASLLIALNAVSLKPCRFFDFLTAIKWISSPFWAFLPTRITDFFTL